MSLTPTKKIWMDGDMVDWDDARVHVLSHTLHYGTGAFEGIRAYKTSTGPAIFRLREHMERLLRSTKILMIDLKYGVEELCDVAVELVRVNELNDGCYLRPIVYLGYGEMGVNPLLRAGQRRHGRLAVGRLPGRGEPGQGRADEDLLVGAPQPRRDADRAPRPSAAT